MQYWKNTESWNLKSYSNLSSNSENFILSTTITNTQTSIFYLNHSLTVLTNGISNEIIYLTPKTYILYSTLHIGILSFDIRHHGKWILSFYDEPSAVTCVETLKNNGLEVANIPKLMSKKVDLESSIKNIITNPEFPHFVAQVENVINKTNF